ncbi:tigger transposable element-derived protein 1 [Trichonephila clavipes]|nr:tigger transposable element-derived protein 1 [Trichonephila clavipes]
MLQYNKQQIFISGFKVSVVKFYFSLENHRFGKGEGSTAIGEHFNLGESTVRAIKKNEAAIRKSAISGRKLSTKFASYIRDVLLERTERAITIWIKEQVQRRISITGESVTAKEGAAKILPEELAKIIEDGDYSAYQVFNADETGLYWNKLPNRTYIAKDERTASGHNASKDQVTLLLCSNASGDRMLKSLLINKSLRPHALKDEIINLAHEIGGDGFNTFSYDDIDELLVDDALSDNGIIDLTLDLTVDDVVGIEAGLGPVKSRQDELTYRKIREETNGMNFNNFFRTSDCIENDTTMEDDSFRQGESPVNTSKENQSFFFPEFDFNKFSSCKSFWTVLINNVWNIKRRTMEEAKYS